MNSMNNRKTIFDIESFMYFIKNKVPDAMSYSFTTNLLKSTIWSFGKMVDWDAEKMVQMICCVVPDVVAKDVERFVVPNYFYNAS